MPLSGPLYERVASAPLVPAGLPLVVTLTGFTDAGGAIGQVIDHFRSELEPTPVAVFDADLLLDYRARRPIISFEGDHFTEYRAPRLELSLAHDDQGAPFLLLAGFEPDFAWNAFAETVVGLTQGLSVSSVTWVQAIAMPVPHTRPLGTTVSGTRKELTRAHSVWQPHTQVPASAAHLLEYRFAQSDAPVAGFTLLVPHYLGDTEFPGAAIAALDSLAVATGLVFDSPRLRDENQAFMQKVTEQVENSSDLGTMLHGLEERYDSYMAGSDLGRPIIHAGDLPSADELAAELERFLAGGPADDDKQGLR
ncbi:proteasome assembly chaperone family protein [Microbacterium sp.]|uniref:proteasome assembly chaperone family protein n=1 Tax=Microbacterium sp. TaxID=51671 RepID=UPI003A846A9C